MAARNFLPRYNAFELKIFNDSIGIQLKNAVHLGKKSSPPSLAQSSFDRGFIYGEEFLLHMLHAEPRYWRNDSIK